MENKMYAHMCTRVLCEGWCDVLFYFGFFEAKEKKEKERVKLDDTTIGRTSHNGGKIIFVCVLAVLPFSFAYILQKIYPDWNFHLKTFAIRFMIKITYKFHFSFLIDVVKVEFFYPNKHIFAMLGHNIKSN